MVLEWLISAFRRFCLCDSMVGQLKVLGGLSSFIFYDYYFFCLTKNDVGIGSDHLYFLI